MTESTKNERFNKQPIRRQAICKICNGELKDASFIERCQHVFCLLCIQKHAADSNKCPVCDKEFTCYLSNISNNLQCQVFYVKKPTISVEESAKEKVESCPCDCQNHRQNTACNHKFCRLCFRRLFLKLNECSVCCKTLEELINNENNKQSTTTPTSQSNENVLQKKQLSSSQSSILTYVSNLHKVRSKLNGQTELTEKDDNGFVEETRNRNIDELTTNENRKKSTLTSQSNENDLQLSSSQSIILKYASALHKVRSKQKQLNGQTELSGKGDNGTVQETRNGKNIEKELITNENCEKIMLTSQSNGNDLHREQLSSQSTILKYASILHKVRSKLNGQTELKEKDNNKIVEEARNKNIDELTTNENREKSMLTSQSNENDLQLSSSPSIILKYASALHKVRSKQKQLNGQTELSGKGDNGTVEETRNRNIEPSPPISDRTSVVLDQNANVYSKSININSRMKYLDEQLRKTFEQMFNPNAKLDERIRNATSPNDPSSSPNDETPGQSKDIDFSIDSDKINSSERQLDEPVQQIAGAFDNRDEQTVVADAGIHISSNEVQKDLDVGLVIESPKTNSEDDRVDVAVLRLQNENAKLDDRYGNENDVPNRSIVSETPQQSKIVDVCETNMNSCETIETEERAVLQISDDIVDASEQNVNENGKEIEPSLSTSNVIRNQVINADLCTDLVKLKPMTEQLNILYLKMKEELAKLDERSSRKSSICEPSSSTLSKIQENDSQIEAPDQTFLNGKKLEEKSKSRQNKRLRTNHDPRLYKRRKECCCTEIGCKCVSLMDPASANHPHPKSISTCMSLANPALVSHPKSISGCTSLAQPVLVSYPKSISVCMPLAQPTSISCPYPKSISVRMSLAQPASVNHPKSISTCVSLAKPASVSHPNPKSISVCKSLAQVSSVSHPKSISVRTSLAQPASVNHPHPKSISTYVSLAKPASVSHPNPKSISVCTSLAQPASISRPYPKSISGCKSLAQVSSVSHPKSIAGRMSLAQPASVNHPHPKSISMCVSLAQPASVNHPHPKSISMCVSLAQPASVNHPHPKSISKCVSLAQSALISHPYPKSISGCTSLAQVSSVSHPKSIAGCMSLAKPVLVSYPKSISASVSHPHPKSIAASTSLAQSASADRSHLKSISAISNQGNNKECGGDDEVIQGNFCIRGSYSIRRRSSPSKPLEIQMNTTYEGDRPATELMQLMGGRNESQNPLQRMINSGIQDCNLPVNNYANQRQYSCMYQGSPVQPVLYATQGPYAPPGQYTLHGLYANPGPYANNLGQFAIQRPYMNPLQNSIRGPYSNPGPYVNIMPCTPLRPNPGSCIQLVQNNSTVQYFSYF